MGPNFQREETKMKADFTKQIFVQVADREADRPIYSAFVDLDEADENAENCGDVGVYELVAVKHLKVTRELK